MSNGYDYPDTWDNIGPPSEFGQPPRDSSYAMGSGGGWDWSQLGWIPGMGGAIMDYQMNKEMMEFSGNQAELQRGWSSGQADKNRAWMEKMSNTAIQRRSNDLKAAGFNPIMAVAQNGASSPSSGSPSGASASSPSTHSMAKGFQAAVNSAMSVIATMTDRKVKLAEAELKGVQKGLVEAQAGTAIEVGKKTKAETAGIRIKNTISELDIEPKKKQALLELMMYEKDLKEFPREYARKRPVGYSQMISMVTRENGIMSDETIFNYFEKLNPWWWQSAKKAARGEFIPSGKKIKKELKKGYGTVKEAFDNW